jgi:hypothetical protein
MGTYQIGSIVFILVWVIASVAIYRCENSGPRWLAALGSTLLGLLSASGLAAVILVGWVLFGLATGRITG